MFEGEKTTIFWIGLIIFGLSLASLFTSVWYPFAYYNIFPPYYGYYGYTWKFIMPWVFGSFVFLLIGWYMMKYGVKKEKESEIQVSPKQV